MDSPQTPNIWRAEVSTALHKATADQIWPLLLDFFNLHKWFPGLATCRGIHGSNGELGAVRYCTGFSVSSQAAVVKDSRKPGNPKPGRWSKEKLVSIDHVSRRLSYEIVDSNIGFESYVSTIGVVPMGDGCVIEWKISVKPVEGWRYTDLVGKYEVGLKGMAKNMEDHVLGFN